ncbi:hypothetical protein MW290_18890 [Aquincola tertiaricarbonis]|uniref:Uncharacterized protein n=1 Tax=Aquincola tertiaricarbonis TaxID=391953 RepID=A0ABY4SGL7_AQUTE|nr:hypothetical protein [Aquincola tertiaricarbonis]URI11037.1 hypothetical protein MW290_18890 [Aquincola tertiaricarbonis]
MNKQHTQGPWEIDPEDLEADPDSVFSIGIWAAGSDGRVMVAHVSAFGLHSETRDGIEYICPEAPEQSQLDLALANAHLIKASPDLLAAARCAIAALTQAATFPADVKLAVSALTAAVTRATGGAA